MCRNINFVVDKERRGVAAMHSLTRAWTLVRPVISSKRLKCKTSQTLLLVSDASICAETGRP